VTVTPQVEESETTTSTTSSGTTSSLSSSTGSDIVETLQSSDNFDLLFAAIDAADLEEALKGPGPFTLFAPTDTAFNSLPDGTLDTLLEDPGGQLTTILLYHVVPGRLTAEGVSNGLNAQTVEGRTVQFSVSGDSMTINDANVVIRDIEAANGVIHVIDSVISPSAGSASASNATSNSSNNAATTNSTSDAATTESTTAESTTADQQGVIDNLPVLDDASNLSSSETNGNPTVSYESGATIEEVAEFYNQQMPLLGYDSTRSAVTDEEATLTFSDDANNIQVSITSDTADTVLITITVVEA
jgi:uncharacterized surface protein with fasciclin (FAS1) repeats